MVETLEREREREREKEREGEGKEREGERERERGRQRERERQRERDGEEGNIPSINARRVRDVYHCRSKILRVLAADHEPAQSRLRRTPRRNDWPARSPEKSIQHRIMVRALMAGMVPSSPWLAGLRGTH